VGCGYVDEVAAQVDEPFDHVGRVAIIRGMAEGVGAQGDREQVEIGLTEAPAPELERVWRLTGRNDGARQHRRRRSQGTDRLIARLGRLRIHSTLASRFSQSAR